ncbi:hypothetical protein IEQ34_001606 [Dendrobium chrysotoxum]|uniref:Uncharacterized protein n=1 Tax=Dendrobium chrysotoxum TaxID=161865 RepID=A0AAV7HR28_DENCH|nr:hypothetical protein IEQ34_001606 [Dendrobium chrysotoxum]
MTSFGRFGYRTSNFSVLLAVEQCDANIGLALLTYASFLSQPDLRAKEEKDRYLARSAQNEVRLITAF